MLAYDCGHGLGCTQVTLEMQSQVAVTPPESGMFMTRMMAEVWAPYMARMMLKDNLAAWQVRGAPRGISRHAAGR